MPAFVDLNELSVEQFKALKDSGVKFKHNPDGSVPANNPVHGPGGLFSGEPGARPGMYSAIVQPRTFLSGLPIVASEYENEIIEILTAQSATTGANPTDWCGTPVTPGDLYKCAVTRRFGKLYVGGKKVQVPEIGKLNNRADQERQILNYANGNDPLVPDLLRANGVNLRSESAKQLFEIGIAARRAIAPVTIDGNNTVAAASAELGWIREFDGLSRLITTGITDTSGATCPAADSLIITWDDAASATVGGANIVETIHDMFYSRAQLAADTGFENVEWEFVGDKRLFRQLVFLFACTYANARCTDGAAGTPLGREAAAVEARQQEMARGQYLLIDGQPIPFRFTPGTEVTQSGATFTGDLFLLPIRWTGGPLTYIEYFPMNNNMIQAWNGLANTTGRQVINDGLYMLAVRSDGFCDQLLAASQMRLMLDVPFLAARIDGINFASYVGYRDFDPANTTYFYSGGTSYYGTLS